MSMRPRSCPGGMWRCESGDASCLVKISRPCALTGLSPHRGGKMSDGKHDGCLERHVGCGRGCGRPPPSAPYASALRSCWSNVFRAADLPVLDRVQSTTMPRTVIPTGLEPVTSALGKRRSDPLSYGTGRCGRATHWQPSRAIMRTRESSTALGLGLGAPVDCHREPTLAAVSIMDLDLDLVPGSAG